MLNLGLTRFVPWTARGYALRVLSCLQYSADPRIPARTKKRGFIGHRVAIAGLFGIPTGLARGAQLMFFAHQLRGEDVVAIDLTRNGEIGESDEVSIHPVYHPLALGLLEATDLVIHVNPPRFLAALRAFDPKALRRVTIVGMWAWELERAPPIWARCAQYCDEIWSPSPFASEAIRRSIGAFVGGFRVVPHAVESDPFRRVPEQERRTARSLLGIAAREYVVGYSFSMTSNFARKNPLGAVAAFARAFPDDKMVRLVLRCKDRNLFRKGWNEIEKASRADKRILLLDSNLPNLSIRSFYSLLDVYLSMHRSEGYGLTIVEAVQAGIPVITNSWGLAPDIAARPEVHTVGYKLISVIDPQGTYSRTCRWADPSIEEAAALLQRLRRGCGTDPKSLFRSTGNEG